MPGIVLQFIAPDWTLRNHGSLWRLLRKYLIGGVMKQAPSEMHYNTDIIGFMRHCSATMRFLKVKLVLLCSGIVLRIGFS